VRKNLFLLKRFSAILLILLILGGCASPENTPTEPAASTEPAPTLEPTEPPDSAVEPVPTGLIRLPVPESAVETAAALMGAEYPHQDYYRLAVQLQGFSADELVAATPNLPEPQVGERANFFVNATLSGEFRTFPARLRHISDNAYWWSSVDALIDDADIVTGAENFEETVFPTNRLIFGREWSPGIDNDHHIHFLLIQEESWGGFFGYFARANEFPTILEPTSNEREMLVINVSAFPLTSDTFPGKLAHEYQHLIQWNQDPNEDLWLNEALSELAYFLIGAPTISSATALTNAQLFAQNPNNQLTARPERRYGEEDLSTFAHYGAERAFMVYLFEQFGPEFIQKLAANPLPGVISIQDELNAVPGAPLFSDVYASWLLANLLNQPNLAANGQFGYREFTPILPNREIITTFTGEPIAAQLPPYGARYYEIQSGQPVKISFKGSTHARLTPVDPASGEYAWYSNRGDSSDFSLTRSFDLTGLTSATLQYKVWYEFEEYYDFGYVEISTDGGEHWQILPTRHGTDHDPFDRSYGVGYTGTTLEWLDESIDLTPYAGQVVDIRFEVISDFSTNRDGLQLDDIQIPELGYFDGGEDALGGWTALGFVRSTNFVPVRWVVWLVELASPDRVTWIEVGSLQEAEILIEGFGTGIAAIVISPTAPVTTNDLDYELIFEYP